MHNCSTALDQTTWGIHLNFDGHIISPPDSPAWLTPLQRQDWQRPGIVVWNADLRVVTHLYARYALEIFEGMQANDVWKSNNFVIGSPTYTLSSETVDGTVTLENQIELAPDQANVLFGFLNTHKKLMEYIAIQDEEVAEDALRIVFRMIAAFGRKVRERRKDSMPLEILSPRIHPTFIPRGKYSLFIKPRRSAILHPNKFEPGSEKANWKHLTCWDLGSSLKLRNCIDSLL